MRFVLISGAVLFSLLNKFTVKPNYLPPGSAYSHLLSDNKEYYMAIDMFLKVEGVTGESKDANHASWIDVLSFNWGAAQPGNMAVGGGGGAGKVNFQDLRRISFELFPRISCICFIFIAGVLIMKKIECGIAHKKPGEYLAKTRNDIY